MTAERFLTAKWRYLAMLNFAVDPGLVRPRVPAGTELDFFEGKAYISLVGFRFLGTKVRGWPVPFHRDFSEVNLRFYVRRKLEDEKETWRRGVVFIRELVPRRAIALVARRVYNEPYVCLPMHHQIDESAAGLGVRYEWTYEGRTSRLFAQATGAARGLTAGSHEQFITEHYWGYTAQRSGGAIEYRVEHPPWNVWRCTEAGFAGDARELYGAEFEAVLLGRPDSAFIADGSAVTVFRGRRIE